jgi:hypothetical protein
VRLTVDVELGWPIRCFGGVESSGNEAFTKESTKHTAPQWTICNNQAGHLTFDTVSLESITYLRWKFRWLKKERSSKQILPYQIGLLTNIPLGDLPKKANLRKSSA